MSDEQTRDRQRQRGADDRAGRDGATIEHATGAETQRVPGRTDDPLLGTVIDGKYRVDALIGAGGMGRVYRGRNLRTDSPVAIKTLLPDLVVDDTLTKRFEVEAKAASNLRHPNTIRIFDFGHEGDILFMVMELLDGMSLEGLLSREGSLPPARVLHIVREVCKSLDEAHRTGLVHRDIKPDNIFLNRVTEGEDHVKVLDFGVAKLKNKQYGEATLTQAGMIFGTPRYMSPEQARAFELDGRSDIYALGVIMFEALTGVPPFVADDPVGVLIKHVNEPPPPFSLVNPELAPMVEVEALVMRCLAKKPDERFDDVRNLMNAIDGVAPMYGLSTGAISASHRAAPEATSNFTGGPNTPRKLQSAGFASLGVGSGRFDSSAQKSAYTMGADRTAVPTEEHRAQHSSPPAKIALLLGVVVVLAGVALVALVGGGPDAPPAVAPAVPSESASAAAPAVPVAPVVRVADFEVRDAVSAAAAAAAARVVPIELRAEPPEAAARARVAGSTAEPVPLPHTFVFTRDPASPPAQLTFEVSAEGYSSATHTAPLSATAEPIVVRLRRPSTGGSSPGSVRVPPPRDRADERPPGFRDPYSR